MVLIPPSVSALVRELPLYSVLIYLETYIIVMITQWASTHWEDLQSTCTAVHTTCAFVIEMLVTKSAEYYIILIQGLYAIWQTRRPEAVAYRALATRVSQDHWTRPITDLDYNNGCRDVGLVQTKREDGECNHKWVHEWLEREMNGGKILDAIMELIHTINKFCIVILLYFG